MSRLATEFEHSRWRPKMHKKVKVRKKFLEVKKKIEKKKNCPGCPEITFPGGGCPAADGQTDNRTTSPIEKKSCSLRTARRD